MLQAARRIRRAAAEVEESRFLSDLDLLDVVRWNLVILGEASTQLSDATRER